MLTVKPSKRLQITQAQLQEISYAPEQNQETSMPKHNCKRLLCLSTTEVEHLIYNQWCSQYKSDTNS